MKILSFILGYFVGKLVTTSGSWSAATTVVATKVKSGWSWVTSLLPFVSK